MTTRLALDATALAAAVRTSTRGDVDPVALLVAIHDAETPAELAAARLAAIGALGVVGGRVWAAGCPVTDGADAVALGCQVGHVDDERLTDHNAHLDQPDQRGRVHLKHGPLTFATRIAWLTARTESRHANATRAGDAA
jgi:hypothetical protein